MSLGLDTIVADALDSVRSLDVFTVDIVYFACNRQIEIPRVLQSKIETEQQLGIYIPVNYKVHDFLFPKSFLILSGRFLTPTAGHVISTLDAEGDPTGDEFTVNPLFDNPPWRYSDTGQSQIRVHTKQTKFA